MKQTIRAPRRTTIGIALTALISAAGFAAAAPATASPNATPNGSASDPYAPAYHHAYRHGAVPTLAQLGKMHAWAKGHASPPQATAVGTTAGRTLYFQGGSTQNGQAAQAVVSSTPKVYLVFWGSQWGTQSTNASGNLTFSGDYDAAAPAAQGRFKGLGTGGEQWSGVMTQYCDGSLVAVNATSCPAGAPHIGYPTGGALAGVWYDNASAEPQSATGTQLGNEAVAAASHFGNLSAASNRYAQYIVISAPGTNPDNYQSGNAGCAWHSDAYTASNVEIAFTNQPYNMDTNFCGKDFLSSSGTLDGFTMTLGHEYAETLTDQYPSSGWVSPTATDGGENGDDCAWISSGQGAAGYVATGTGSYAMQSTWSNDTNECDLSHPTVGAGANVVTVTNPGAQSGKVGVAASLAIKATDSGSATLSYAASGLPAGLAINATTGVISGTPSTAGTSSVSVTATDSTGVSGSTTFSWTVASAGTTGNTITFPTPVNYGWHTGQTGYITVTATDSQAGQTLTYAATGLPSGLSENATTGRISGTPSVVGTYHVTLTATDTTGAKGTTTFTIYVTAPVTCSGQLIKNGGFESGATNWTATSGVIQTDGAASHTGYGYAWLDGYSQPWTDTVAQTVTIPAGCKATMTYWVWISTSQTSSSPIDTLRLTANGVSVQTLSNASSIANQGYVKETVDLSAYAGKTVALKFTGAQATSVTTSFLLDDIALNLG